MISTVETVMLRCVVVRHEVVCYGAVVGCVVVLSHHGGKHRISRIGVTGRH